MNSALEILTGMLLSPRRGLRRVIQDKPYVLALLVFTCAVVSSATASALAQSSSLHGGMLGFAFQILSALVTGLAASFFLAAIFHLSADLLRGAGSGAALFIAFLLCCAPWLFNAAGVLVITAAKLPEAAVMIWRGILALWWLLLSIIAIKEIYRFTFGRTLATLLLPVLLAALTAGAAWGILGLA